MKAQIMTLALFALLGTSCTKTLNEVEIISHTKSGESLPEFEIDQWLDVYDKAIEDKVLMFETTEDIQNNSSLDKEESFNRLFAVDTMYVEDIENSCMIPQVIAEHLFHEENIHSIEYFIDNGEKAAARAIGYKYNYNGDKISDVKSPWLKL